MPDHRRGTRPSPGRAAARTVALPRATTDAGLAHVARLPTLKFLILRDAPVTDAGIQQLSALTQLESLYSRRTAVTDEGIARLKEKLPSLHVHW